MPWRRSACAGTSTVWRCRRPPRAELLPRLRGVVDVGVAAVGVTAVGGVTAPSSGGVDERSAVGAAGTAPVLMAGGCAGSSSRAGFLGRTVTADASIMKALTDGKVRLSRVGGVGCAGGAEQSVPALGHRQV